MLQLPGISNIDSNGQFHFESGYPSNSHFLAAPIRKRGTLTIGMNASADFTPDDNRISLPPMVTTIANGSSYHIKRSSRNYIIQIKVPILESRRVTERKLNDIIPIVMGDITLDRKELML